MENNSAAICLTETVYIDRVLSYVHSLMSYEDLRATINPHTNRRSWKIKQYSKHLYNYN